MQVAMLLTRPFTTFQVAVVAHGIGEVARSAGNGRRVRRHATVTSGLAIVIAAVNGVVMVVLPAGIGRVLLGASWGPAKPLLLAAAVQLVCLALATGPQAGLLGLREMGKAMGIGVLTAIALFGGAGIGALLDGAKGALWLIAAGQGLVAIVSWIVFTASTRQIEAPSAAVAAVVGREPALTSQAPVTTQQTPLAPPPAAPPVIVAPPELAAPPVVVVPASLGELLRDPRLHLRRGVAAWRAQQLERRASWRRIDGYLASIEAELSAIQRPEPAQAVGRAPHAAPPPPDPMEERLARWLPPGPPSATAGPR
jgi:hypothetical protein